jgi:hypothetical protein
MSKNPDEITNADRAAWARMAIERAEGVGTIKSKARGHAVLDEYTKIALSPADRDVALTDMIADVLHLTDQTDADWYETCNDAGLVAVSTDWEADVHHAMMHYTAEVSGNE